MGFGPGVSGLESCSSASEARFFLPNPQLLARLASVPRAVAPAAEPAVMPTDAPESGEAERPVEGRGTWYDAVLRRYEARLAIPSVGDPSGEGSTELEPCLAALNVPATSEEGDTACSEIAVVATAFTLDEVAPNGIRAENLDDARDALEPGRSGDGRCPIELRSTVPVWVGEDGGCGEAIGDGGLTSAGGLGSTGGLSVCSRENSGGACASRREREDGPAVGEEFTRGRTGNSREFGARVALNASSPSFSGGPPGTGSGLASSIGGLGGGGLVDSFASAETFFIESRRFDG